MVLNGNELRNLKKHVQGFDYNKKYKYVVGAALVIPRIKQELNERGYDTRFIGPQVFVVKLTEKERQNYGKAN